MGLRQRVAKRYTTDLKFFQKKINYLNYTNSPARLYVSALNYLTSMVFYARWLKRYAKRLPNSP